VAFILEASIATWNCFNSLEAQESKEATRSPSDSKPTLVTVLTALKDRRKCQLRVGNKMYLLSKWVW